MKKPATHNGTCQNCERKQKLPDGMLSKHGYQVAGYGFFNGVCWAAGELPYEMSCDCIKNKIIPMLQTHITNLTAFKKKLMKPATEPKGYWQVSMGFMYIWQKIELVISEQGNQEMIIPASNNRPAKHWPVSCYSCYFKAGKTLLETATNMNKYYSEKIQQEIRYTKRQLEHQQKRVVEWKIRPLELINK